MDTQCFSRLMLDGVAGQLHTIDQSLQEIVKVIRAYMGMEVAFIAEFVENRREFRWVDVATDTHPVTPGAGDPLESTYCQRIVDGRLPSIVPDTAENPITRRLDVTDALGIGCYMGVPVELPNGDLYGTLCCFKAEADTSLTRRDLNFVQAFAGLVGRLIFDNCQSALANEQVKETIEDVLAKDNLTTYFQPIVNCKEGRITGFEALTRFNTEPYRPPNVWFDEAIQVDMSEQLEMAAIALALKSTGKLSAGCYIGLNVSPTHILSGALHRTLLKAPRAKIVIEITEHAPIDDYPALRKALAPLRAAGARLAVDDAGAGYASFQHTLELDPDLIKLDISLIRDIHQDPKRRALATALVAFARSVGAEVIAEGVEQAAELQALNTLGVHKLQGYYIGRPMPLCEAEQFLEQKRCSVG